MFECFQLVSHYAFKMIIWNNFNSPQASHERTELTLHLE